MVYRVIALVSESVEKGVEIVFVEFQEQGGKWSYEILQSQQYEYDEIWKKRLDNAINVSAMDYQLLHIEYGNYAGQQVNKFIEQHQLQYKVALIISSGHTVFHLTSKNIPVQLGDGAAVAAATQLPVVSDFYSVDTALGGMGESRVLLKQKFSTTNAEISNAVLYAFMGVLRWRQEYNVFSEETGASRNSIGGALWIGQEG